MSNKNSIASLAQQLIQFNKNAIEIITKLDQAVSSNASSITVTYENPDGTIVTAQMPTLGSIKSEIDNIRRDLNTLSGVDGNSAVISTAQNQFKRIIVRDLNLEPNDLDAVGSVDTFKTDKNWIFDAMLNPLLSIEINLTGKIQDSVRKVLSRRFIVQFDRDANGALTTLGQERLTEFNTKYKGRDDVNIIEFVSWLGSEGLMNRTEPLYDEQIFDLQPHRLQYNGYFSVLRQDVDTLNKKLWYVLDTLDYQDVSSVTAPPTSKTLTVGDRVAVVPSNAEVTSTTIYKVVETSTATSEFRVCFEREQGDEPISTRVSALRVYSPVVYEKKVRVSIGFDEYNVIFLKPLNTDTHILSKNWSKGVSFYSSDLRLDSSSGMFLKDYYFQKVYDYGAILQDLVAKKIPTAQGVTPSAPVLSDTNFKVVQINKHLTDTPDAEKVRTLHNNKNNIKSELEQIQSAITNQGKLMAAKVYTSESERKQAEQELSTLTFQASTRSARFKSIVDEIIATKKNINKVDPKYRVRGFWAIPAAVQSSFTQPQEVVQFEVQYRYANLSGSESPIDTFKDVGVKGVNAAYSQWIPLKTDVRKRTYNSTTGEWTWEIEDVSDADTPNINQLDIAIQANEQVEIKIRSISEVGYPEAPLVSEWSDPIIVKFPTDLNSVLADDEFILKEATQEEMAVRIERSLDAKGYARHVEKSKIIGNEYFPHEDKEILTSIKDSSGNIQNLYNVLTDALNRIATLEEQIKRAKGELKVTLHRTLANGTIQEILITNGSSNSFTVELENLVSKAQFGTVDASITPPIARSYTNETKILKEFKLRVENAAKDNVLGLLSTRNYGTGQLDTAFAYTTASQATWVDANNKVLMNPQTSNVYTQKNNQWIWLKNTGDSGARTHYSDYNSASPATGLNGDFSAIKYVHDAIKYGSVGNYGLRGDFTATSAVIPNISDSKYWNIFTDAYTAATNASGEFAVTMHPQVESFNTITEQSSDKLKLIKPSVDGILDIPLLAYWKFNTTDELFDLKTNTWFYKNDLHMREEKEDVIRVLMEKLTIASITEGSTATLTFAANGSSYTTGAATTTTVTGSGNNGLTVTVSSVDGGAVTAITLSAGGTGYKAGDVFNIVKSGGTGALGIVLRTNADATLENYTGVGVVTEVAVISLYTLAQMGLTAGDYLMLDGAAGMTEINNRLVRITTSSFSANTVALVVALNSTAFTPYTSGATLALLTDVTTSGEIQVWNSIGRDSTQNAPITKSMFVVKSNGLKTAKTIKRSLAFYLEPENTSRAFEFTLNFTFRQFRDISVIDATATVNNTVTIG